MRTSSREGLPVRLERDGRVHAVTAVLDVWRVGNRWWRGELPSTHYLLELENEVTAEVLEQGGAWCWVRVMD